MQGERERERLNGWIRMGKDVDRDVVEMAVTMLVWQWQQQKRW